MLYCSSSIYLFDLWKMKVVKTYTLKCSFVAMAKQGHNTLLAIDQDRNLHRIDLSPFNRINYLDYIQYITDHKKNVYDFKDIQFTSQTQKLDYFSNEKIIKCFNEDDVLVLVHKRSISLIFQSQKQPYHLHFQQSSQKYKF